MTKEDIFENIYGFDSSIIRSDIVKKENIVLVNPDTSSSNLNSNDLPIIIESADFQNITCFYKSELIVTGSIFQANANPLVPATDNNRIAPINNFPLALFDSMTLYINDVQIETLRDVYFPLTMLKFVTRSRNYINTIGELEGTIIDSPFNNSADGGLNNGWFKRNNLYMTNSETRNNIKHFQVNIKLEDIFGYCADYRRPLYKCRIKLVLQRKVNQNQDRFIFHTFNIPAVEANPNANPPIVAVPAVENNFGYIQVDRLQLRIPQVFLETQYQSRFERMFLNEKEVSMLFNQRSIHNIELSGSGLQSLKVRGISNPPEFILACLIETTNQAGVAVNTTYADNSGLFNNFLTNNTIEEVYLTIGDSQNYPSNPLKSFDNLTMIQQMYKEYTKLCQSSFAIDPMLTFNEFKNNYPFICFDLRKHDKDIFVGNPQINMNFILRQENPRRFRVYILYVENCLMKAKFTPNGISELRAIKFNSA